MCPDGKVDMKKLSDEYDELEQAHNTTYGEFKTVRDDYTAFGRSSHV